MKITSNIFSGKEWNDEIIPAVQNGILRDVSKKYVKPGFCVIYQSFEGALEDETGKVFRCVGWCPPNGKSYVEISLIEGN
jgi:hypothetical protein